MAAPMERINIFCWGANSYGQLALGHNDDLFSPNSMKSWSHRIPVISGGGGHTFFLSDGQLSTCGSNVKGQLGHGHNTDQSQLMEISTFGSQKIVKAVGGWDFSLAITDEGQLYAWGSNAFGQLGLPEINKGVSIPTRVNISEEVVDVVGGMRHSICLTKTGKVFAWGSGSRGQLGLNEDKSPPKLVRQPQQVPTSSFSSQVCSLAAGCYHTAALCDDGELYVWGQNKHGQMGVPTNESSQVNSPIKIKDLVIRCVCSGWTHFIAETASGEVLSWGRGDYGQLGRELPPGTSYDHQPKPVANIVKPKLLHCGAEHNLAINDAGLPVSWGWNEHGICGTGDETNVMEPRTIAELENLDIVSLSSGSGFSFCVAKAR